MEKELTINTHGCMLTDYFSGTTGVMVTVFVCKESTVKDLIENFENEINMIFDHICFVGEKYNFSEEEITEQLKEKTNELKEENKKNMNNKPYKDILDFTIDDMIETQEYPVFIFTIDFEN